MTKDTFVELAIFDHFLALTIKHDVSDVALAPLINEVGAISIFKDFRETHFDLVAHKNSHKGLVFEGRCASNYPVLVLDNNSTR